MLGLRGFGVPKKSSGDYFVFFAAKYYIVESVPFHNMMSSRAPPVKIFSQRLGVYRRYFEIVFRPSSPSSCPVSKTNRDVDRGVDVSFLAGLPWPSLFLRLYLFFHDSKCPLI